MMLAPSMLFPYEIRAQKSLRKLFATGQGYARKDPDNAAPARHRWLRAYPAQDTATRLPTVTVNLALLLVQAMLHDGLDCRVTWNDHDRDQRGLLLQAHGRKQQGPGNSGQPAPVCYSVGRVDLDWVCGSDVNHGRDLAADRTLLPQV
jgi:hypothetical protein